MKKLASILLSFFFICAFSHKEVKINDINMQQTLINILKKNSQAIILSIQKRWGK